MILTLQEFRQMDFRGINFLLSPLAPAIVNKMSETANSSFQEAMLAVHGNDDATLPFPGFDQECCELKAAKFRAEKKIRDRLLPKARLYTVCYFPAVHALYVNLPNWIRLYLMRTSGELSNTSSRNQEQKSDDEWFSVPLAAEVCGIGVSIFEDDQHGVDDWSKAQPLPRGGTSLRLAQFLEMPTFGEAGHLLMPIWTLNLVSEHVQKNINL